MYNLSVIIPHHNTPDLLERCLNSIPEKDDVQIIVVDDNSSDDIVDFKNFPGNNRNNLTCVFDKKGGRAGYARNKGIDLAKGKWIVFADADDFFEDGFYENVSEWFNSDADVILFKLDSKDSATMEQSDRHLVNNKAVDDALKGEISDVDAVLALQAPTFKMISHTFLIENNIRFEEIICTEDVVFVTKLACLAHKIQIVDKSLYVITTRQDSLSQTAKKEPEKFLCSVGAFIRRNKLYGQYNKEKRPIILYVWQARKLGFITMCRTLWLIIKKGALFSGFNTFLKIVINHLKCSKG